MLPVLLLLLLLSSAYRESRHRVQREGGRGKRVDRDESGCNVARPMPMICLTGTD